MNRFSASIGLALLLSIALALPVSAGDQRPIRGQFNGSGVDVGQRCPDALTIGFTIDGTLSHLGRMTGGGTNCTEFTLGSGTPCNAIVRLQLGPIVSKKPATKADSEAESTGASAARPAA